MMQVSLWSFISQTTWEYLSSSAFREWCVFGAEILVAWVIYLEFRHSRSSGFLAKVTDYKANKDRRAIYNQFLVSEGSNLQEKSEAFCKMILMADNSKLKARCERQISLFGELELSNPKPFWSWRGRFDDDLVSLLPHAAIYIWVILHPHILKRRQDTGPWYAKPFMRFALRSLNFVLRFKRELHIHSENGERGIVITIKELEKIRQNLQGGWPSL
jgi:hypothetical protein